MRKASIFAALVVGLLVGALAPTSLADQRGLFEQLAQQFFGGAVQASGATDGQVLTWDATARQWEAADAAGGYQVFDGWSVTLSGNQTLSNSASVKVAYDTEGSDTGSRHSAGRVTFGSGDDGTTWHVQAGVLFASDPVDLLWGVYRFSSSDTLLDGIDRDGVDYDGAGSYRDFVSGTFTVAEGDYLEVRVRQITGGNLDLSSGSRAFRGVRLN